MKSQKLSVLTCIRKAEAAKRQAVAMIHRGYSDDEIELVKAAAREWMRRSRWASKHGGTWDSFHYWAEHY